MVIRDDQIAVFSRSAKSVFLKELTDYVRTRHGSSIVRLPYSEFPVSAIPTATLEAMIQAGIDRAGSHGIRWKSTQVSFVVAMVVVAPNFDDDLLVRQLLCDADIEPDYRMDSVLAQLTEDHWNALRQKYDPKAWGLSNA